MIVDHFFKDFDAVRTWADDAIYVDVKSPQDGVVYPNICAMLPDWVAAQALDRLQELVGFEPQDVVMFCRLSPKGCHAPHGAHTDTVMGDWSLMVYLNRASDCQGGTELVKHVETGLDRNPTTEAEYATWVADNNVADRWAPVLSCEMAPNRAFIFPAHLMHRAAPVGGFGSDTRDGRLVLTAFFKAP